MAKAILNVLINLLATIIQLLCTPINLVVSSALPDLTSKISQVTSTFGSVFNNMSWALSIIPSSVLESLSFVILCEIAKHTIFTSTHILLKVWTVIQKIKFW